MSAPTNTRRAEGAEHLHFTGNPEGTRDELLETIRRISVIAHAAISESHQLSLENAALKSSLASANELIEILKATLKERMQ